MNDTMNNSCSNSRGLTILAVLHRKSSIRATLQLWYPGYLKYQVIGRLELREKGLEKMSKERVITHRKCFGCLLVCALLVMAVLMLKVNVEASTTALAQVKATAKSQTTSSTVIGWNQASGANGYVIYRRESTAAKFRRIKVVGKNTRTYTDRNVISAKVYEYAVRAYRKSGGKNVYSTYKSVKLTTLPTKTTVTATASGSNIKVTWKDVDRETGYKVYRKKYGGKWGLLKAVKANTTSYTDTTAAGGSKYYYCVRAYKVVNSKRHLAEAGLSKLITVPSSTSKLTTAQKEVVKKILYAVETGGQVYGNQRYDDFTEAGTNSTTEIAITIGAGQWYATEAQRLLKLIRQTNKKLFESLDTAGVGTDLDTKNWSTYKIKKTSKKAKCIQAIISSTTGIKCQDQLMYQQIEEYETEIRKLNVTNTKAVCMCINLRHLGGLGSVTRVLGKTAKPYTMARIWNAMQTDTGNQVGGPMYKTRHQKVMGWINQYI